MAATDLPTRNRPAEQAGVREGIGASVARPDGILKTNGQYAYSSDLWAKDMLWGATLRSPHAHARIRSIDVTAARRVPGVHAVLTHEDVPGVNAYGLEFQDQPVLAHDVVRFEGEPVAVVAADHPDTARHAASLIAVDYEALEPVVDMDAAMEEASPRVHPDGNVLRRIFVRHGDVEAAAARADVVVTGEYELGMQDQAFLGPESGLAIPAEDGGVDLYVSTQWLHADAMQMAGCLGLAPEQIRVTLAGVGGAFGGREDLSIHVHASMLALRTGRPIKMSYARDESFTGGHVHRHPARMRYEHGATREGRLVYVRARIVMDGGAYASTSGAVATTAAVIGAGPYEVPNAELEAFAVYTNNPPCGAMRGFGSVQVCFGHESQMDKLAAALELDPIELRRRNAMAPGTLLPTGQAIEDRAPVATLLDRLERMELPAGEPAASAAHARPGGLANTTHGEGVRRGVGYAIGFKNIGFPAGMPDFSTARVRLSVAGGEPIAEVHTAAAEVGQGLVTVQAQIARSELGVERAFVRTPDLSAGMAGGSSASRQTWMTGGAVKAACDAVRERVLALAGERLGVAADGLRLADGRVTGAGDVAIGLAELLGETVVEEVREYHPPRPTSALDENGQGSVFWAYAFSAHRAVVDVDVELGLVKVVEVATVQDVGRAINPQAIEGQIEGGIAQGVGLATMEEVILEGGRVRNGSFTDYLIPTTLDMPPVRSEVLELAVADSPYGVTGVGEPPMISSPAAVAAAIRAATGRELPRIPVRPEAIVS